MSEQRPVRVLHVFHRMDRGGAETWIVSVMRRIDRERFQFDFLVESDKPGAYDDEIRSLGGEVHHAGSSKHLLRFARAFRRIVREHGPYDVVHSHVHHASGVMLALAAWQGVPTRIAHSHSDIRRLQREASLPRRVYYRTTETLIDRFATTGIAVSRNAASSLFGADWEQDSRWRVLHCGIDLAPFAKPVDREAVRARLGLPANAFVVGHVGRFMPVKNHAFLVDVFARVYEERSDARLLLVGDGPLRSTIERKVAALGLEDAVVFAGVQTVVPEILLGAVDVFVLPSHYEGIPLVLIEAQAAGLPSVVSRTVSTESVGLPQKVRFLDLSEVDLWVDAILEQPERRGRVGQVDMASLSRDSVFSLQLSVAGLESVYIGPPNSSGG